MSLVTSKENTEFDTFVNVTRKQFEQAGVVLFKTNLPSDLLWNSFVMSFQEAERQYYNCSCCRRFFERYGDLVKIDDAGRVISALWNLEATPEKYKSAVKAILQHIRNAKIKGVFASGEHELGQHNTKGWPHMSVHASDIQKNAHEYIANKQHAFENVTRAIEDLNVDVLQDACTILESDVLYRNDKVLGAAQWLLMVSKCRNRNQVWKAVATAPEGFCHPRSSMIWTLLEDLGNGLEVSEASERFAEKMHPLRYQRPQAPPKAGTILQAEKAFEAMGAASALRRRFLRPDEIKHWSWQCKTEDAPKDKSLFAHLKLSKKPLQIDGGTKTWEKFVENVLPEAKAIKALMPKGNTYFFVLTTAADPDCVPILQWDFPERRNTVSMHTWHGGTVCTQYGFGQGSWVEVIGICNAPEYWGTLRKSDRAMLCLKDAKESMESGLAIFPENLKSEFHGVRSVIEAHSRSGKIEGTNDGPHAICLTAGKYMEPMRLLVTTDKAEYTYTIDRFE